MRFWRRKNTPVSNEQRIAKVKMERKRILNDNSGFFMQEAYKTLRTNVNFSLADTEGCKVLMVTSAVKSEGKSLTALNLAISLAQIDKKVLIMDCDLRRPKLNRLLDISAPSGISNVLMDVSMLDKAIIHNKDYAIDVILAGDIPPNPAELLSSVRMQKLLENLRQRYDYIIVDSPPVNLVIDAVALSPRCDGVLLVVRANSSERGAVIHAMQQLEYVKANVLGFVFNAVTSESGSGYGKYRYHQYSRYTRYHNRYGYYGYGYGGYGYGYGYGYGTYGRVPNSKIKNKENPDE